MDEDWEDYSYYRKPRMQLASAPAGPSSSDGYSDEDEMDDDAAIDASAYAASAGASAGEDGAGDSSTGAAAKRRLQKQRRRQLEIWWGVGIGVVLIACGVVMPGGGGLFGLVQFLLLWVGASSIAGPFAPRALTGGDCRIGVGPEIEEVNGGALVEVNGEGQKEASADGSLGGKIRGQVKGSKAAAAAAAAAVAAANANLPSAQRPGGEVRKNAEDGDGVVATGEWTRSEWEQLRKLVIKFPRGTPQRWETIARALSAATGRKGVRSTEEVVRASKAMAEQKPSEKDAFAAFLAQRKAASSTGKGLAQLPEPTKRWEVEGEASQTLAGDAAASGAAAGSSSKNRTGGAADGAGVWTDVHDRALLQALKEFPKDSPLRWERVAAAIPGRTKQQCYRRFTELRDSFRASSAAGGGAKGVMDDDDNGGELGKTS